MTDTQKITLVHGRDGYIVQAVVTGFDPSSDSDAELLRDLKAAIDARRRVFAFDDLFEVTHIFDPTPDDA